GEFQRVFHDSGFSLEPLDSGEFLLLGPDISIAETLEPARYVGESVADVQTADGNSPALRRLGAEIEMWLHEHPVKAARVGRGEAPVNGLWLWGGGCTPASHQNGATVDSVSRDLAFGRDAYLQGLWASIGEKVLPLPEQLSDVFGYPE